MNNKNFIKINRIISVIIVFVYFTHLISKCNINIVIWIINTGLIIQSLLWAAYYYKTKNITKALMFICSSIVFFIITIFH